jgi:hypothetical protein
VDLGIAEAALESAGIFVRVLLFRRGIIHPATGAGEFFGCPDAVGHDANDVSLRNAIPTVALNAFGVVN